MRVPAIALDLSGKRVTGGVKLDHLVRSSNFYNTLDIDRCCIWLTNAWNKGSITSVGGKDLHKCYHQRFTSPIGCQLSWIGQTPQHHPNLVWMEFHRLWNMHYRFSKDGVGADHNDHDGHYDQWCEPSWSSPSDADGENVIEVLFLLVGGLRLPRDRSLREILFSWICADCHAGWWRGC